MARWHDLATREPEFAGRVRAAFDLNRHKLLATLRKDGSPRISGIELQFEDGDLWIGSMVGSLKGNDLRRDPRLAIHCSSKDHGDNASLNDAKLAGRTIEAPNADEPNEPSGRFRIDISEVVLTSLGGDPPDHLVIESWHPDRGLERRERY